MVTSSGPVLNSLLIDPTIDVRSSLHTISLSASASSSAGEIDRIELVLDHAVEASRFVGHGIDAPEPTAFVVSSYYGDGRYVTYPVLHPFTDGGGYTVVSATIYDRAGNSTRYDTAQLAAMGSSTDFTVVADVTPPDLGTFRTPGSVAMAGDPYRFAVGVIDPGPTVGLVGAVVHERLPDGTERDATIEGIGGGIYRERFSNGYVGTGGYGFAEAGVHHIIGVTVNDYVGNTTSYDASQLAARGYATSFVVATPGDLAQVAPNGYFAYDATATSATLRLDGNVQDYTLSRGQPSFYDGARPFDPLAPLERQGDFVLTATNGSGIYSIGQSIETVQFQNGQYLALRDVPSYVGGSAALSLGGNGEDILYQTRASGYEAFAGGAGNDELFLRGNVRDYDVRAVTATSAPDNTQIIGLELIGRNGSGAILVDRSVETIHFQNGQYLAYGDVTAYVAAAPEFAGRLQLLPDGLDRGSVRVFDTVDETDTLLLDGNAADYMLSREQYGAFVLSTDTFTIRIDQAVDTVQFANGQYLVLRDLPAYVGGDATFTAGSVANDLLFAGRSGDQYVVGSSGTDGLYLRGNVGDYRLNATDTGYSSDHPSIDGYRLAADNGSSNIYIDRSVETVHFQNGQYLAFEDLPAYIAG